MRRTACAASALGMIMMGCPDDSPPRWSYDCVGRSCAERTIATFVPAGKPVHDVVAQRFTVSGRGVQLTSVRYGEESDYGHSSLVCAIEDIDVVLLHADCSRLDERPFGLESLCANTTLLTTACDQCPAPGRRHPLLESAELLSLARDECRRGGSFRGCLTCLCRDL